MARIPVTLLSGYLGSGKTTLLLHLLHDARDKRIGIVVNDLAATNIDAKTIQQSQDFTDNDKLVAISGGSIGSDYRQSFCDAIYTLANSGTIDLLVVEASGIARPQLAAKAIARGRNSEGRTLCTVCRLDTTVTIVDALRLNDVFNPTNGRFDDHFVTTNQIISDQIEFCDVLVLNKTDLITKRKRDDMKALLRVIQPKAMLIETTFSRMQSKDVLFTRRFDEQQPILDSDDTESLDRYSGNEAKAAGIHSFIYRRRLPFHPLRFDRWLDTWPPVITRCKGVMWLATQPTVVFKLSQAGRAMDLIPAGYWIAALKPDEIAEMRRVRRSLNAIWHPLFGDRMIELVFIGHGMNEPQIVAGLDGCLLRAGEPIDARCDPFRS